MQAAARERAHAELNKGGFDCLAKGRQPSAAAGAAHDIRFFHNLAQCAEVRERICGCCGG